jgi:hypothetical protein
MKSWNNAKRKGCEESKNTDRLDHNRTPIRRRMRCPKRSCPFIKKYKNPSHITFVTGWINFGISQFQSLNKSTLTI